VNIGIGAGFVLVAAVVAAVIPVRDAGWRLAVVAVAVGWSAAVCVNHLALASVALLGWLVVNGFLVDRYGELSWHGPSDLYRMLLLVVAGALGLAAGEVRHQLSQLRARWRTEAEWQALVAHIKEEEKRDA
jgi:MFS family permease